MQWHKLVGIIPMSFMQDLINKSTVTEKAGQKIWLPDLPFQIGINKKFETTCRNGSWKKETISVLNLPLQICLKDNLEEARFVYP